MARIGAQRIPPGTLLLLFLDAFSVGIGLLIAISLRFHDKQVILQYLLGPHVIARLVFVIVVCEAVLYYSNLYDRSEFNSGLKLFM